MAKDLTKLILEDVVSSSSRLEARQGYLEPLFLVHSAHGGTEEDNMPVLTRQQLLLDAANRFDFSTRHGKSLSRMMRTFTQVQAALYDGGVSDQLLQEANLAYRTYQLHPSPLECRFLEKIFPAVLDSVRKRYTRPKDSCLRITR